MMRCETGGPPSLVSRLGIHMFREYPAQAAQRADIDSGPIVWGAGVTATGVGLAASLAHGDLQTAEDIYGLAAALGLRRSVKHNGREARQYLFGRLPVGDAFLTWGHTRSLPELHTSSPRSLAGRLWARKPIVVIVLVYSIGAVLFMRWVVRRSKKKSA